MTPIGATGAVLDIVTVSDEDQRSCTEASTLRLLETRPDSGSKWSRSCTAIVGLGYVGLPTALSLASPSRRVVGIDVDLRRLESIRCGQVDLRDDDRQRLRTTIEESQLELTDSARVIGEAGSVIVCVPTPVDEHLTPDLSFLRSACTSVVAHARRGQTIILTSTSYVGTTRDLLIEPLVARGFTPGRDIFVAFSPERIDPGLDSRPQETVPRVVGGATERCSLRALEILGHITTSIHPVSSPEAAELTKLYENTFRAINIAFANEMAAASRVFGLDIAEIITAASTKPFGFMPFYPGAGVGGHCIPCDPHYLLWQLRAVRHHSPLIEEAMFGISSRPGQVVQRASELLASRGRSVAGSAVLVVGVSYKPGVADLRGSPAIEVIDSLTDRGAQVAFHDPLVPKVLTRDGRAVKRVMTPASEDFDLVIVHGLQPGCETGWIQRCALVLDTTYRLTSVAHRAVL